MMEPDELLRGSFFGLMGARHDERPKSFPSDRPSWEPLNSKLFYLIQRWLTSPGRSAAELDTNPWRYRETSPQQRAQVGQECPTY
jgi:hypothetical protein